MDNIGLELVEHRCKGGVYVADAESASYGFDFLQRASLKSDFRSEIL